MDQIIELGLRVLLEASRSQSAIVPVVGNGESIKAERVVRHRGINDSAACCIHIKSVPSSAPVNFVPLVAPNKVVFVRVHGENHPQPPLGVYLKDDEIAVVFGSHLNRGAITGQEAAIIADPKLDRRVTLGWNRRTHGRTRHQQRKE